MPTMLATHSTIRQNNGDWNEWTTKGNKQLDKHTRTAIAKKGKNKVIQLIVEIFAVFDVSYWYDYMTGLYMYNCSISAFYYQLEHGVKHKDTSDLWNTIQYTYEMLQRSAVYGMRHRLKLRYVGLAWDCFIEETFIRLRHLRSCFILKHTVSRTTLLSDGRIKYVWIASTFITWRWWQMPNEKNTRED